MISECEEPKCTRPASKSWGGRKVCADHFDQYQDEQERMYMDLY